MTTPPIVLYSYKESPFGQKLELILRLKQLPYSYVNVPNQLPRPEVAMLGITYRKNPSLAIGNNVYFDSYQASIALDKTFPDTPLLKPNEGLQRALSYYWSDRAIFSLVPVLMEWHKRPEKFLRDRETMRDGNPTIVPDDMVKARPWSMSALRSQFDLLEIQLAERTDESHYLLNTPKPTFLDISVYVIVFWCRSLPASAPLFESKHPLLVGWMSLFAAHVASLNVTANFVSAEEGAKTIFEYQPSSAESFGSEEDEPLLAEAGLNVKLGEEVEIAPNDYGKVPQKGKLVAITSEVVVVEVTEKDGKRKCKAIAPRIGFTITKV